MDNCTSSTWAPAPGFPGLPLAIARPGELRLTFIESVNKKCEFIRQMNDKFDLRARILNERAEIVGQDYRYRAKFDIATARAVGGLTEVAELTMPFVAPHGYADIVARQRRPRRSARVQMAAFAFGRRGARRDSLPIARLGNDLSFDDHPEEIADAQPTFPRAVGVPKKDPLSK